MDKPIKVFLAGVLCAALITAAGYANTYRLESKLHRLELACVEEGKQDKSEWGRVYELVCDAKTLVSLENDSEPSKGIQSQIVQAQHAALTSREWPYLLAISILLLTGVPWVWYFLLQRIRELRDAIVGK